MTEELEAVFGRFVHLLTRRRLEQSPNCLLRLGIPSSLKQVYAAT